jgi:hypothetical protein
MSSQPNLEAEVRSAGAQRLAEKFFQTNLTALSQRQPDVADLLRQTPPPELIWLLGRDGSLTARDPARRWWSGSSLPLDVGRSLMKTLDFSGAVGLVLAPGSAGQIRAALEKLPAGRAIIAALPNAPAAVVALHCDDFSIDLAAERLWLVCGDDWSGQLARLLRDQPGLCVPQQYIRTGLLSETDQAVLIAKGNDVLSAETARRSTALGEIHARRSLFGRYLDTAAATKICVVTGSTFKLWELAAPTLAAIIANTQGWRRLDKDRPTTASPLALAAAAAECHAVLVADLYRADLPGVVPDDLPWITWATEPRFPAYPAKTDCDALLLADESWRPLAASSGWPNAHVAIAAWPSLIADSPRSTNAPLALIADAVIGEMPKKLRDFSSHLVLWQDIAAELAADPLAVGNQIDGYLSARISRLQIDPHSLDRELFKRALILPAWRRGIARALAAADIPVILFGDGWDDAEFANGWGGHVHSMDDLQRACRVSAGLIYPSPIVHKHPIHALGRPVLRPPAQLPALIRDARALLSGRIAPTPPPAASLSPALVLSLLKKP